MKPIIILLVTLAVVSATARPQQNRNNQAFGNRRTQQQQVRPRAQQPIRQVARQAPRPLPVQQALPPPAPLPVDPAPFPAVRPARQQQPIRPSRQSGGDVEILSQTDENIGDGNYQFSYSLSDGTSREETGTLQNPGQETAYVAQRGTITWTAPTGEVFTLSFIADENGFQPVGDHLPA